MPAFVLGDDYEPDPERVAAIKSLRKGAGFKKRATAADLTLFGVEDVDELGQVLWDASLRGGQAAPMFAIRCALNVLPLEGLDTLAERRALVAGRLDVSLRTVMRLEEEGAEALTYFVWANRPRSDYEYLSEAAKLVDKASQSAMAAHASELELSLIRAAYSGVRDAMEIVSERELKREFHEEAMAVEAQTRSDAWAYSE
jgi:hypothetical protein